MPAPRVSIRLGTDGKAQVQKDFADIGDAGDAQSKRIASAFERDSAAAEASLEKLNKTAQRLAAVSPNAAGLTNTVNPVTGGSYAQADGRAEASARAIQQQMVAGEQAAQRLLASIDPLYAAQLRYDQALAEANTLQRQGLLTTEQFAAAQTGLRTTYDQQVALLGKNGLATNQARIAQMEFEHAIRGSIDAFAAGAPPAQIFAMHLGMLAQSAQLAGGSMGKVGEFLSSGWGIALTVAVMALGPLVTKLFDTGNTVDGLVGKLKAEARQARDNDAAHQIFAQTLDGVTDATRRNEEALKKLGDQNQSAAQQALAHALAQIQLAKTVRDTTQAQLDNAKATLAVMQAQMSGPGHQAEVAAFGIQQQEASVTALQQAIGLSDAQIQKNQADVIEAMSRLSVEAIDKMSEPVNRIKSKYGSLIEQARQHAQQLANAARAAGDEAKAQALVTTELQKQLAPLKIKEQAEIDAEQARDRKGPKPNGGTAIFDAQIASFFDIASKYRGDGEKSDKGVLESFFRAANENLDPEKTAWCAAFVNAVLAAGGVHGTGSLAAKSFLTFGKDDTHSPQKGDIVVLRSGAGEHVGFLDSINNKTGAVSVLAGNTSNKVAEATYGKNSVLAIRRPPTPSEDAASQQKLADHAAELQREAQATDNATTAALALANAYLTSGSAAAVALAARQSVAKATTQQTDADAAAARQLKLDIATGAADGAKKAAELNDQTAARKAVDAAIANGTLKVRDSNRAMQDEAALRPLLALQAVAQGDAYTTLTAVITAYRKALAGAHAEEDQSQAIQRIAELGEQHAATMKLLSAELQLAGAPQQAREESVRLLERELQLRQQLPGATDAQIRAIVAETAAEDDLKRHVDQVTSAYDELHRAGEGVLDDLFNVDNWTDPLKAVQSILKNIEQEFVDLAFKNPLKNMLFGDNQPTLNDVGGVGGFFKALAGGGGKKGAGATAAASGLTTAGTTLNTAASALTSSATLWQQVAAELEVAAAHLGAAGAAGGGGGFGPGILGSLLGAGGTSTLGAAGGLDFSSLLGAGGAAGSFTASSIAGASFGASSLLDFSALGLARGGFVSGPGGPTSDTIPAMLSNGEYVLSADAVRMFGPSFLDAMNSGKVPHKKHGGLLGTLAPFLLGALPGLLFHNPLLALEGSALSGGLSALGSKIHGPIGDILRFAASPALFLGEELFGHHGGKSGTSLATPNLSIPTPANSNTPAGDTYHINVQVGGGGGSSAAQDRATGMQIGAGIRQQLAMTSRKGLLGGDS